MVAVCEKSPAIACGWVLLLLTRVAPLNDDMDGFGRAAVEPGKRLAMLDKAAGAVILPQKRGKDGESDCGWMVVF